MTKTMARIAALFETPVDDWHELALCREVDPELFFPPKGKGNCVREAKQVCAGCPVRDQCLDEAVSAVHPLFGIWGGLTERERRPLRRAALKPGEAA